ncbi:Molybdenum cofactor guanylyltransferase [hydrothermal vent metagenome]|uniref:Molybdenum cofactor guanylyltransferase n=1 Tax=hydrothermal vent metagenome TaxID=652676 RepID=A0A3B0VQV8_9ZZZZ
MYTKPATKWLSLVTTFILGQPPSLSNTSAVILAGGQGKRVGLRQKALLPYQGRPLLHWVLQRLTTQGVPIWLNVNSNAAEYEAYGLPQFSDQHQGFLGPLSGMQAAWNSIDSDWIVFVPCDNPNLPQDLIVRLMQAQSVNPAPLMVVQDGQRIQPLYLLMHRSMRRALDQALARSHLSASRWIQENQHTLVDFSDQPNGFQNLNVFEAD